MKKRLRGRVSLFSSKSGTWAWDVFLGGRHVRGGIAFGVCAANTAAREWMRNVSLATQPFSYDKTSSLIELDVFGEGHG